MGSDTAMTPERWQEVRRIFDEAVERPPDLREALVQEACAEDQELAQEVHRLLGHHESAGDFIEEPFARLIPPGGNTVDSPTPERIGPWRIESTLGRGGMGTVFLASRADEEFRRQVAIKVLQRGLTSEALIRRFRSERQILADLDHPNIAKLLDGGTLDDGRPYLVMEHVDGRPLDRYCREEEVDLDGRITLFRKICSAVHFAHQSLIVHRDLKPSNILVTEGGEPKLLDFGIAKLLAPEAFPEAVAATEAGLAPLTLEYASPEQIRGGAITTASDVYSLGVVLFEVLTGEHPYRVAGLSARAPLELAQAVCEAPLPRPSEVLRVRDRTTTETPVAVPTVSATRTMAAAGVQVKAEDDTATAEAAASPSVMDRRRLRRQLQGDLDNVVLMALRKEPQRRYASAQELSEDLDRYQRRLPVRARADTFGYRSSMFVRRHRLAVGTAVLALAALVAFTIALVFQVRETRRERDAARREQALSEEVTGYLQDLFDVSDPDRARGQEVLAREILDQGAQEIERRFAGEPQVRAELMETIGRVYRKLALFQEAEPLLVGALELRRSSSGGGGAEREATREALAEARSLIFLADLRRAEHRFGESEEGYRAALKLLESREGAGPAVVRETVAIFEANRGLGLVVQQQGRYGPAQEHLERALDLARRSLVDDHGRVALALEDLAGLLRESGERLQALDLYQEALEVYRRHIGRDHPGYAAALNNLGVLYQELGEYAEAEDHFRQAMEIQEVLYEEGHPRLGRTRENLASVLYDAGRLDEALALVQEVLASRRSLFGSDNPATAQALHLLGLIHSDQGNFEEALGAIEEAVVTWRQAYSGDQQQLAAGLSSLAIAHQNLGALARAEGLYREALAMERRLFGRSHVKVAAIEANLAQILIHQGQLEPAVALLESAAETMRQKQEDAPDAGRIYYFLAQIERKRGHLDGAETAAREAERILAQRLGEDHPETGLARCELGRVMAAAGKPREAEGWVRGCLEVYRRELDQDHAWVLAARLLQGEVLVGLGRLAEARSILEEIRPKLAAEPALSPAFAERADRALERAAEGGS